MTSLFSGIDYPRRHVASLTDFPSTFPKKLHPCASLPESTQPRLLLSISEKLQLGRQWDPELRCRDHRTSSPVPEAAEVARAPSRSACPEAPGALSSQSSCVWKTSLLRGKVVLTEEAGKREDPHFGMSRWTPLGTPCVCAKTREACHSRAGDP